MNSVSLCDVAKRSIGERAERCVTEDKQVKCNAANTVFNRNCGLEAIRVWLLSLPRSKVHWSIFSRHLGNVMKETLT